MTVTKILVPLVLVLAIVLTLHLAGVFESVQLPMINNFVASPGSIATGQSSTLSWNVSNATGVIINQGLGNVGLAGTVTVSPSTTTVYTLTASNNAGNVAATAQVVVTTPPTITNQDRLQLLSPANGSINVTAKPPAFTWYPYKEATRYKFLLAKDSACTQIIMEAEPYTTVIEYPGYLDFGENYFWRVKTVEPASSEWSDTWTFQTEFAPPPMR
jgi:hypothetical protein